MSAREELLRRLESGELTDAEATRALAALDDDAAAVAEAASPGRLSRTDTRRVLKSWGPIPEDELALAYASFGVEHRAS